MMTYSKIFRQPETKFGVSQKQNLSQKDLYNKALNYLARREHSRLELKRKLSQFSDNIDDINAVLDKLDDKKLQSDERFSESFIHSKASKYGQERLKETLKQKGVALAVIQEYLPDFQTEIKNAVAILHKKLGKPRHLTIEEKQKTYRFLQYRGFGVEISKTALQQWQKGEENFE